MEGGPFTRWICSSPNMSCIRIAELVIANRIQQSVRVEPGRCCCDFQTLGVVDRQSNRGRRITASVSRPGKLPRPVDPTASHVTPDGRKALRLACSFTNVLYCDIESDVASSVPLVTKTSWY